VATSPFVCENSARRGTSPLAFFTELGARIERRWAEDAFDPDRFSRIAMDALGSSPACERVSLADLLPRLVDRTPLPPQSDLEAGFSDLPITLFHHELFTVEVLIWLDAAPAIHQHGFSGAFQVLSGSSIQTLYDFAPTRSFHPQLASGALSLRRVELLKAGDTRAIEYGAALIHGLFHLDRPTATVVVRTHTRDEKLRLAYEQPGLVYSPLWRDEAAHRQLQALALLHAMAAPDYVPAVSSAIEASDALGAYYVLERAFDRDQGDPAPLEQILARARAGKHAELLKVVEPVLRERARTHSLLRARHVVWSRDLRYLLAVLLNAPTRRAVVDLIGAYRPGEAAADLFVRWFGELLGLVGRPGDALAKLKGPVSEALFVAIHAVLASSSLADARTALAAYYRADGPGRSVPSLEQLITPWPLLRPLLA
jgi:hypothetical protein